MLLRRIGAARTSGAALACFAVGAVAYRTSSLPLVLAATLGEGFGVVWLSTSLSTAAQQHTPARLQGRVSSAVDMCLLGPQTASIAVGAALINIVSYRLMLLVITAVVGGCAAVLLVQPGGCGAGA
jgi:hypothetical protein